MTSDRWLLTSELAQRWRLSTRTIESWRLKGKGPPFTRVGRGVRYHLEDVEAFETEHLQEECGTERERRR